MQTDYATRVAQPCNCCGGVAPVLSAFPSTYRCTGFTGSPSSLELRVAAAHLSGEEEAATAGTLAAPEVARACICAMRAQPRVAADDARDNSKHACAQTST